MASRVPTRVGLVSDTHGLLRDEAMTALAGSDFIVHAGDIGDAGILARLAQIAPVTAVRGNNDVGAWAAQIGETALLTVEGAAIYVLHDVGDLALDPTAAGLKVVVSGHSHRPAVALRNGVLFVNPGSAGPRRFKLPIAVGRLDVVGDAVTAEIVELAV